MELPALKRSPVAGSGPHQQTIANALADPLSRGQDAGRLAVCLCSSSRSFAIHPRGCHGRHRARRRAARPELRNASGHGRHASLLDRRRRAADGAGPLDAGGAALGHRRPPSLLLMGDPVTRAARFPALKYAGAEMRTSSKHFPNDAVVYTRAQASPAAYPQATPRRFSFVHFAAHASANRESPLESAVDAVGPRRNGFKLYARDVADVPLRAELVTVSACRSAGETIYSGEGLVGSRGRFSAPDRAA